MSWRYATSEAAARRTGNPRVFDFIVGRHGTAAECVKQSWGHAPIRVLYGSASELHHFATVWSRERPLEDIWTLGRARPWTDWKQQP